MKHSAIHLNINLSQVAATTETKWMHYGLQLEQIGLAEFFPHIIFLQNLSESLFGFYLKNVTEQKSVRAVI